MYNPNEEIDFLYTLKNRALYEEGYKNSIVEWMLSDDWTRPSLWTTDGLTRGIAFSGKVARPANAVSGEIDFCVCEKYPHEAPWHGNCARKVH
jgi:hypothetical protein